jgi:hypothetical protein
LPDIDEKRVGIFAKPLSVVKTYIEFIISNKPAARKNKL